MFLKLLEAKLKKDAQHAHPKVPINGDFDPSMACNGWLKGVINGASSKTLFAIGFGPPIYQQLLIHTLRYRIWTHNQWLATDGWLLTYHQWVEKEKLTGMF